MTALKKFKILNNTLSSLFSVKRRYLRSVNLERDLANPESVNGYIMTHRSGQILNRVREAWKVKNTVSAFTITGVYGTGKSAFAHFMAALFSGKNEGIKAGALTILQSGKDKELITFYKNGAGENIIRAVTTAAREPVGVTIARALLNGAENFQANKRGRTPAVLDELGKLVKSSRVDSEKLIHAIQELAKLSDGVLIIIDEIGKSLEFASANPEAGDLFLLQQIAELHLNTPHSKVLFFGLLHQSFDEYSGSLSLKQKNEWAKIQGRFEDIPFYEKPEETLYIISHAIERRNNQILDKEIAAFASSWAMVLKKNPAFHTIEEDLIAGVYPLHPVAARILPILCQKFAQNDRSLFAFLGSQEPHSFTRFLEENNSEDHITIKPHVLYDYFLESANIGIRPGFQQWIEIHDKVTEARQYGHDHEMVIKTIGVLNLLSSAGELKASRELTLLALLDNPKDKKQTAHWEKIIAELTAKGMVLYRSRMNEFRIWHGSEFDIEKALQETMENERVPLAAILNRSFPLRPLIIQRHSFTTGTLRYFERRFIDSPADIEAVQKQTINADGIILYWTNAKENPPDFSPVTVEGKPVVLIHSGETGQLQSIALEFDALKKIRSGNIELQSDLVAAKEINQRIHLAENRLFEVLEKTFDFNQSLTVILEGDKLKKLHAASFNASLSALCDKIYYKSPILNNELVNRRELTTQGSKAVRMLLEAMVHNHGQERLALDGYGPETSIFESVLKRSGLYTLNDTWEFTTPSKKSGLYHVWNAAEKYLTSESEKPQNIMELYSRLQLPPYGMRAPVVPLLVFAILIKHSDDMSLYHNGTFIPVIATEQVELFIKRPENFSVKYFQITGIKSEYFKELESVFQKNDTSGGVRNATILNIVKPFIRFINKLPAYSRNTNLVSAKAKALIHDFEFSREPDELLFRKIPVALGFKEITSSNTKNQIKDIKKELIQVLVELDKALPELIDECRNLILHAFGIKDESRLRETLRVRTSAIGSELLEPMLQRFITAAKESVYDDKLWMQTVLMVVADKPVENWKDEDINKFKLNLTDISRRFRNLEALYMDKNPLGKDGFDARRITITTPDGKEHREVVYLDHAKKQSLDDLANSILQHKEFPVNESEQKALLTVLYEKVLNNKNEIQKFKKEKSKHTEGPELGFSIEEKKK